MARIHRRAVQKKCLYDLDRQDGVVTHLEPDILQCEVKWASNKASGVDEILVQLFKKLKDDAVKVLHSTCQQIWKTQKVSFYSNLKEGSAKEYSTYCTITLISYASKVMLKILQARLQQYVN